MKKQAIIHISMKAFLLQTKKAKRRRQFKNHFVKKYSTYGITSISKYEYWLYEQYRKKAARGAAFLANVLFPKG